MGTAQYIGSALLPLLLVGDGVGRACASMLIVAALALLAGILVAS